MFDITYDSDYHVFIEPIAKKARGMRRLFTAESVDNVIDIQEASTSKSHGENHYSIIAEPTNNTQTAEQFKCLEQPIFSDFDSDDSIADPNYVLSDQEENQRQNWWKIDIITVRLNNQAWKNDAQKEDQEKSARKEKLAGTLEKLMRQKQEKRYQLEHSKV
jgi:hypothetical protein